MSGERFNELTETSLDELYAVEKSFSPDYSTITAITSPHIAQSDGVVYGWYSNADQANRWITINGNQLYSLTSGAQYSNGYMPAGEYIVEKGDVITFGGSWGGMRFVSMRGVN